MLEEDLLGSIIGATIATRNQAREMKTEQITAGKTGEMQDLP